MWKKRNAYRILMGRPEGRGPLGTLKRGWVENIKNDLRERVSGGMDYSDTNRPTSACLRS
jgi:hypothetical protein